jgi:hypothetical protein
MLMVSTEMTMEELEREMERIQLIHLQTITEMGRVATKLKRAVLGKPYKGEDSVEDMHHRLCMLANESLDRYGEIITALFECDNRQRGLQS